MAHFLCHHFCSMYCQCFPFVSAGNMCFCHIFKFWLFISRAVKQSIVTKLNVNSSPAPFPAVGTNIKQLMIVQVV